MQVRIYICPQDRRRIHKKSMAEYIIDCFSVIFGRRLTGIDICNAGNLQRTMTDVTESEVYEKAEEIWQKAGLCNNTTIKLSDVQADPRKEVSEEICEDVAEEICVGHGLEDFDDPDYEAEKKRSRFRAALTDLAAGCTEREEKMEIEDDLDALIGVADFKKVCRDILTIEQAGDRELLKDYFTRCAVCFSIAGGDGFSEYMKILAKILADTGMKNIYVKDDYNELKKNVSREDMADAFRRASEPVSMDLTFMMEDTEKEEFRDFLRNIASNCNEERLPVFIIPYVEGSARDKMVDALSATFPLIYFEVPPFTTEQYLKYAEKVAEKRGYSFETSGLDELEMLIVHERNRKHFYGFMSIQKLVGETIDEYMTYAMRLANESGISFDEKAAEAFRKLLMKERTGSFFWGFKTVRKLMDEAAFSALRAQYGREAMEEHEYYAN